jgi:chromosome segregation ATPase
MPLADLVAEQLAADVLQLEHDVVAYRSLAQSAINELHEAQLQIINLQAQLNSLRDEIRRYVAAKFSES